MTPVSSPARTRPESTEVPARNAERTRERLITAARKRFASDGYSATTVREIADDAQVNVALISRYFGSKEGLFETCLQQAVEDLREAAGVVDGLEGVPRSIARQVISPKTGRKVDPSALLLLLRSSGDSTAEAIRVRMFKNFSERLVAVSGRNVRTAKQRNEALLRAQLVLCTSIGIALMRTWPGMDPLASAGEADLVKPLEELTRALLAE